MSSLKKFRIVSYGHATHPTARVSGEVARCQKTAAARTFLGGVYDFMIMIFRSRRPSARARGRRPGVLLPGDGSPALRRAGGAALSPPSGRPGRTLRRKKLADTALPVTRRGTGAGGRCHSLLHTPSTCPQQPCQAGFLGSPHLAIRNTVGRANGGRGSVSPPRRPRIKPRRG